MFCDRCGTQVGTNHEFCHSCGKRLLLPAATGQPGQPPTPQSSMASHFRTLGILWLAISGFRLIPAGALLFSGRFMGPFMPWHMHRDFPFNPDYFLPGLLTGIGSFFAVTAALGFLAGYGLLERRPWARMLAIVLGVFALFDFPFGTALGVYTLWTLLSPRAEQECRQWA